MLTTMKINVAQAGSHDSADFASLAFRKPVHYVACEPRHIDYDQNAERFVVTRFRW